MSDMIKSDYELNKAAESYARAIFEEFKADHGEDFDPESMQSDMFESAWESADQSEHVIYTARAISIACNCSTDDAESRLEDIYSKPFDGCETFAEVCTRLAFMTLLIEIESELETLIDKWEPEESEDDSEEWES